MRDANSSTNRYVSRLGLGRVPRVEEAAVRGDVKLFHLMVVALIERGGPMTLEEVAARLAAAGVTARTGDLPYSLLKAWHGRPPVVREPDGRFAVDLSSSELRWVLLVTGLLPPDSGPRLGPDEPPPPLILPSEDVPLTPEEVEAAFRNRGLGNLSSMRQAAAVLDARGAPMRLEAVEAALSGLTPYRDRIDQVRVGGWRSPLVTVGPDGRLVLDRTAPEMPAVRRFVRRLAAEELGRRAAQAQRKRRLSEFEAACEAESKVREAEAARLARAIVRVLPDEGPVRVLGLLDLGARAIRTFLDPEPAAVREALERFDLLTGIAIRESLHRLGLDPDSWRLADLGPPQKTVRLNRTGRMLRITVEMLISATTGIGRPLADPAKVGRYLAKGERTRLARRLESDLKALHAFYQYGRLHGAVRLRWGFLDERFPVDWLLPGEPTLWDRLRSAGERRTPVEVVVGGAPGWSDPWSRARRGLVAELAPSYVAFVGEEGPWQAHPWEIQALRVAP